jgi:hypothetical protein
MSTKDRSVTKLQVSPPGTGGSQGLPRGNPQAETVSERLLKPFPESILLFDMLNMPVDILCLKWYLFVVHRTEFHADSDMYE